MWVLLKVLLLFSIEFLRCVAVDNKIAQSSLGAGRATPQNPHWLQCHGEPYIRPKITHSRWPIPKSNYLCLIPGPIRPTIPNRIHIRSAVLPQCTGQTDTQTNRSLEGMFDDCIDCFRSIESDARPNNYDGSRTHWLAFPSGEFTWSHHLSHLISSHLLVENGKLYTCILRPCLIWLELTSLEFNLVFCYCLLINLSPYRLSRGVDFFVISLFILAQHQHVTFCMMSMIPMTSVVHCVRFAPV